MFSDADTVRQHSTTCVALVYTAVIAGATLRREEGFSCFKSRMHASWKWIPGVNVKQLVYVLH